MQKVAFGFQVCGFQFSLSFTRLGGHRPPLQIPATSYPPHATAFPQFCRVFLPCPIRDANAPVPPRACKIQNWGPHGGRPSKRNGLPATVFLHFALILKILSILSKNPSCFSCRSCQKISAKTYFEKSICIAIFKI